MKFDELLKRHNVSTALMKFVDDDPYKKYDNIVDAYHDAKQFRPDDVSAFTLYDSIVDDLNIKIKDRNSDELLDFIYRRHPNSDLTDDALKKYVSFRSHDGNMVSIYDLAMQQGRQIIASWSISEFVQQYNDLVKRVRKQTGQVSK